MERDQEFERLAHFAQHVLAQAQAVTEAFAARGAAGDAAARYADHVGPHLRHVIEHFRALLTPAVAGVVAYDARPRDPHLSACPATARRALGDLRALLRMRTVSAKAPVRVAGVAGIEGETAFAVSSTFGRELVYVALHAVHHFALIKPHCLAAGISLAPEFGMAPATVQHERRQAHGDTVGNPTLQEKPVIKDLVHRVGRRALLFFGIASLFVTASAQAAPPINTLKGGFFGGRSDTAILGYDTVAYFTEGKPVIGQDAWVFEWMGAKWKFASQANLDRFKSAPEKYAPQYGGYCAYGVSQDNLVEIEPDKFTIIDGKLYLNLNAGVQKTWLKDPAGYIRQADAKFQALLKK